MVSIELEYIQYVRVKIFYFTRIIIEDFFSKHFLMEILEKSLKSTSF